MPFEAFVEKPEGMESWSTQAIARAGFNTRSFVMSFYNLDKTASVDSFKDLFVVHYLGRGGFLTARLLLSVLLLETGCGSRGKCTRQQFVLHLCLLLVSIFPQVTHFD